ncbi:hypothetical protein STRTUCAR8_04168, partial [Streptomyces turgidiscabies Car8]
MDTAVTEGTEGFISEETRVNRRYWLYWYGSWHSPV